MEENRLPDFYTVAEIIMALRNEYGILRNILFMMNNLLQVDADCKVLKSMYFVAMPTYEEKDERGLFVKFQKDTLIRKTLLENLDKYFYSDLDSVFQSYIYRVVKQKDKFLFINGNEEYVKHNFIKSINFKDTETAKHLYDFLRSSDLFKLPRLHLKLNIYQSLAIDGSFIYFHNEDSKNGIIDVIYDMKTDEIKINSNTTCYPYFLEQLLETRIYRSEIPDEYVYLIEKGYDKQDKISVENNIKYRKESFEFASDRNNRLVLKKK